MLVSINYYCVLSAMYCRYSDISQKYDHISPYSTPNNYSRLTRGSSLQDVGSSRSPEASRRLSRQSSLEMERRGGLYGATHQQPLYYHHLARGHRRLGSESGRGDLHEKKRQISCNKVTTWGWTS